MKTGAPLGCFCAVSHLLTEGMRLLWHWAGGVCFHLETCRRADQAHFDFCNRFQEMPLWQAKAACKERYRRTDDDREPTLALTISHRSRRGINELRQARFVAAKDGGEPKAWIEGKHEASFSLVAGTPLIGCQTRYGIVSGVFYRVTRLLDDETCEVEDDRGETKDLSFDHLKKVCRLAWAITIHASQSREFEGLVELYNTEHPYFTMRHLVVATSRVKAGSNLVVVS